MAAVVAIGLMSSLPAYGRKDENNPNKIGHRTIAHKSIISPEKERLIGKQQAEQFENSVSLIRDPEIDGYLSVVTGNIVRHSDWKGLINLRVLKSPDVKSFSLPGGYVYLSSGLLVAAENEDEIAGAIAHQVAHAAARHWASEVTALVLLQPVLLPRVPKPASANGATLPGMGVGSMVDLCCWPAASDPERMPLMYLQMWSHDELEADLLALQYMYEAGYDPNTYLTLLRKLTQFHAQSVGLPASFQAAPTISERIEKAEEEIRKYLPGATSKPKASPELGAMKARLQRELEP